MTESFILVLSLWSRVVSIHTTFPTHHILCKTPEKGLTDAAANGSRCCASGVFRTALAPVLGQP